MARHEKRQRLKELRRVARAIGKRGLSPRPEPVEVAALVGMVDARMSAAAAAGRSARAVALLASLQDRSNDAAPGRAEIACRAGCYHCCDVYVSAPAPVVFAIAGHLRRNRPDIDAEIARLTAADRAVRGKDVDARASERHFCPFLQDGMCGIYPVRPAACRGCFSLSVEACIAGARGEAQDIPTPPHIHLLRGAYEQALAAVLWRWRLDTRHYELTHAVLVALGTADAEARWYDGEDVFAGVAVDQADRRLDDETRRLESEFRQALCAVAGGDPPDGPFADRFPRWCR